MVSLSLLYSRDPVVLSCPTHVIRVLVVFLAPWTNRRARRAHRPTWRKSSRIEPKTITFFNAHTYLISLDHMLQLEPTHTCEQRSILEPTHHMLQLYMLRTYPLLAMLPTSHLKKNTKLIRPNNSKQKYEWTQMMQSSMSMLNWDVTKVHMQKDKKEVKLALEYSRMLP